MPRLNNRGDVCAGIGGGIVSVNGKIIAKPAGGAAWVDDDTIVYGYQTDTYLWSAAEGVRYADFHGPSFPMEGGGGVWAGGIGGAHPLVYRSDGEILYGAGLHAVGPDGSLVTTHYATGQGMIIDRPNGEVVDLPQLTGRSVHMPTPDVLVYTQNDHLKVWGKAMPVVLPGGIFWPRAVVLSNGEWWLQYYNAGRLVLHPWDSTKGYVVATGDAFRPDAKGFAGLIPSTWALNEGETPASVRTHTIDLTHPRTELLPMPTPPPVLAKATIKSFETPIAWGHTSRAVAEATAGTPQQYRWEYLDGGTWHVAATNPASDNDHHFAFQRPGSFDIRLVTLVGGKQTDVTGTRRTIVQLPPVAPTPVPPPTPGPVTPADVWHASGPIFRRADNQAVRYKGVTQFKLLNLFENLRNIDPVLADYAGFNVLETFAYTPVADWHDQAWGVPTVQGTKNYCAYVGARGFQVNLCLLTDDDPARLVWAKGFIAALAQGVRPSNLFLVGGNEPTTHKHIDTAALHSALDASGFPYASGNYEDSTKAFGRFGVAHTSRDSEWVRRGHDLLEYYHGQGPNAPTDPPHPYPWVANEPAKTEDVGPPAPPLTKADDWRAYFGVCALLGAGATFHSQTGKFGQRPTGEERILAAAALDGLNAFPPDAPLGGYSRPVENSLRTYVVGNSMVRCRPTTSSPGSGWVRVGASNVLWRRG